MLHKTNRIVKSLDFKRVFQKSRRLRFDYFDVFLHFKSPNDHDSQPTFGFVVSKKVGKAVVRNLVKRRLRNIVKELLPNVKKEFDLVIITKPGIDTLDFENLKLRLESIFKQENLLESKKS